MLRFALPLFALVFVLPSQAASLKDYELQQKLEKVAQQSSQGTPRALNDDILDFGYQVQGTELINLLGVREAHAEQMRNNPESVRLQLGRSVCRNSGFVQLLNEGATLRYEFRQLEDDSLVTRELFTAANCATSPAQ